MYVCEYSIHVAYGYVSTGSLLSSNRILCVFFACYQQAISAPKTKISPENQCLEPGKHSIYTYIYLFFSATVPGFRGKVDGTYQQLVFQEDEKDPFFWTC